MREIVAVAPPFASASFRFLCAGAALVLWSRFLGAPMPSRREINSTALLGLIMFSINYACLFWAEQRVSSGYAAIIASTIPVWVFAGEWLWLRAVTPNLGSILGMILGISGVVLLVLPGSTRDWSLASMAMLFGGLCWAGGTLWSRRLPMPKSRHVSAGLQMLWGGIFLIGFAAAGGEFAKLSAVAPRWTLRLGFDMAYLIGAASIAAFLAFVWLIDHEPASRVSSHAYVNPVIAVVLGAVVAGERLANVQIAGAAVVLTGVAVTLRAKGR